MCIVSQENTAIPQICVKLNKVSLDLNEKQFQYSISAVCLILIWAIIHSIDLLCHLQSVWSANRRILCHLFDSQASPLSAQALFRLGVLQLCRLCLLLLIMTL